MIVVLLLSCRLLTSFLPLLPKPLCPPPRTLPPLPSQSTAMKPRAAMRCCFIAGWRGFYPLFLAFVFVLAQAPQSSGEEQQPQEEDLRWAPLSSMPPTHAVAIRDPAFLSRLTSWCTNHHPTATTELDDAALRVERRECFRAGVTFCRRHRRMDRYCLLIFQQHYHAANMILAFDGKIGLVLYPYHGAELMEADKHLLVVRSMMDPALGKDHLTVVQRNDTLMEIPSQKLQFETLPLGINKDVVAASTEGNDTTGPWLLRGLIFNTTLQQWGYSSPWVMYGALHVETCRTRPDWESIRVWDVFLFNGEADLLEVRLHELAPVVHKFVIIEFDTTYRGDRKEYQLQKLLEGPERDRFAPFLDQLLYLQYSLGPEMPDLPSKDKYDAWSIEYLQRDAIASGLSVAGARLGDLVLLLDADELVRRDVVHTITKCTAVQLPADLRMDHYMYYNFHWKKRGLSFHGIASFVSLLGLSSSTVVRSLVEGEVNYKKLARQELQMEAFYAVPKAGWHLSYFMSPQKVAEKLGQFAHSEYDTHEYNTTDGITYRMHKGLDLFGRDEDLTFLPADRLLGGLQDEEGGDLLPAYVRDNLYKFRDLLPHIPEDIIITQQQQKQQQEQQQQQQQQQPPAPPDLGYRLDSMASKLTGVMMGAATF